MPNLLHPVSLIVDLDFTYDEPDAQVLLEPAKFSPRTSRIVLHETLHYWQHLSQGFLTRMAECDLQRLTSFEKDGREGDPNQYRLEFVRKYPVSNFSARDLYEGLARYWDVHVMGPHTLLEMEIADPKRRLAPQHVNRFEELKHSDRIMSPLTGGYSDEVYDLVMESAAGNYGRPYASLRHRTKPAIAAGVFPLAGHMAMQTVHPVHFFEKIVEDVIPRLEHMRAAHKIEDVWRDYYPLIRSRSEVIVKEETGERLWSGPAVIQKGILAHQEPYRWGLEGLTDVVLRMANTRTMRWAEMSFKGAPQAMLQQVALDFCFACPGTSINRGYLASLVAPPCIRFPDGRTWQLGYQLRGEMLPELGDRLELLAGAERHVAAECQNLEDRWQAFRRAARGY